MRLPKRRHELLKTYEEEDAPIPLTKIGLRKLEQELERLQKRDLPQAIEDVARTGAFGDRSENAEYQEAKHRLSRTHSRIFYVTERLKRVILIQKPRGNQRQVIQLGSHVIVAVNGQEKTYDIVGPSESNPGQGRISHVSPLGTALMGHCADETVTLQTEKGSVDYKILHIE